MFGFLEDWDMKLSDSEKEIELSIKCGMRSWKIHAQGFFECVFKLFNKEEGIIGTYGKKVSLGSFLNSDDFKIYLTGRTGFEYFRSIKILNEDSNDTKHLAIFTETEESEIIETFRTMHELAVKTYNYLNKDNISEEFDEQYVKNIINSNEEELEDVIEYADEIIRKKSKEVDELTREVEKNRIVTEARADLFEMTLKRSIMKRYKTSFQYEIVVNLMLNILKNERVCYDFINFIKNTKVSFVNAESLVNSDFIEEWGEKLFNYEMDGKDEKEKYIEGNMCETELTNSNVYKDHYNELKKKWEFSPERLRLSFVENENGKPCGITISSNDWKETYIFDEEGALVSDKEEESFSKPFPISDVDVNLLAGYDYNGTCLDEFEYEQDRYLDDYYYEDGEILFDYYEEE